MSEKDICQMIRAYLDRNKFPYQCANAFYNGYEADYWALDYNGMVREFEIKITRQDFLKDKEKGKHKDYFQGKKAPNYFFYVCPHGMILPSEIPTNYGLLWIRNNNYLELIKKPKKLHEKYFTDWEYLCRKIYSRYWSILKDDYYNKEISIDEYRQKLNIELFETSTHETHQTMA